MEDRSWSHVVAVVERERARAVAPRACAFAGIAMLGYLLADAIPVAALAVAVAALVVGAFGALRDRALRRVLVAPGQIARVERVALPRGPAMRVTFHSRHVVTLAAGRDDLDELIGIVRRRAAAQALPAARILSERAPDAPR